MITWSICHRLSFTKGDFLRVEARLCLIHRHDNGEYHHARLEIIYFKRPRKTAKFAVVRKAALDGRALEALMAGLLQIPKLQTMASSAAANTLLLPAGEAATALSADKVRSLTNRIASLLETPLGVEVIASGRLNIDLLTFDHVLARAERLITQYEQDSTVHAD